MWSLNQDPSAVATVGFATGRAAMLEIEQHFECVAYNLMRAASLDISDKTHATSVVLVAWII